MLHQNRALMDRGGLQEKLQGLLTPQIYLALNISDFLDEKKEVQTNCFFKSMLWLTNLYGKAVVVFHNVYYHRLSHEIAQLEDKGGSTLDLPIKSPTYLNLLTEKEGIVDGTRVQKAVILYNPSYDQGMLVSLEKFNFQVPERVKPDFSLRDLVSNS